MRTKKQTGFTLVEVIIAVAILGIATFTSVSAVTYTTKNTRLNSNRMVAKNIAQGYIERMMNDTFSNVGPTGFGTGNYSNIATTANPPVYLDQVMGIKTAVTFKFKGFGVATAASQTSITRAITTQMPAWTAGEWVGSQVYIVENGQPMFSTITANTASSITYNAMPFTPLANAKFMINNGKTVEVTTSWTYLGKDYSQTMQGLIVKLSQGDALGF